MIASWSARVLAVLMFISLLAAPAITIQPTSVYPAVESTTTAYDAVPGCVVADNTPLAVGTLSPINRFLVPVVGLAATEGAVMGDFADYENRSQAVGGFVGQIGVNFTPAGWAGDVRDFTAAANDVRGQGLGWRTGAGVVLAGVAFVPVAGDLLKSICKPLLTVAENVPVKAITEAAKTPITNPSRLLPPASGPNPWAGDIVSEVTTRPLSVERFAGNPRSPWVQIEGAGGTPSALSVSPGNAANRISSSVIPAGTRIQSGTAAAVPEWGGVGGAQQIEILDNSVWQNQMLWEVRPR